MGSALHERMARVQWFIIRRDRNVAQAPDCDTTPSRIVVAPPLHAGVSPAFVDSLGPRLRDAPLTSRSTRHHYALRCALDGLTNLLEGGDAATRYYCCAAELPDHMVTGAMMSSMRRARGGGTHGCAPHAQRYVKADGSSTLSTALLLLRCYYGWTTRERPGGTTTTNRVTPLPEATRRPR